MDVRTRYSSSYQGNEVNVWNGPRFEHNESREAKHIAIAKYAANTAHKCRWEQVFRHEYISLVWLPPHGYTSNINSLSNTIDSETCNVLSYIPKCVLNKTPTFCDCGLDKCLMRYVDFVLMKSGRK